MAIDGGLREKLEPGTKLVARYKRNGYTTEVVAGEEGEVRFRLADGREFKSPSARVAADGVRLREGAALTHRRCPVLRDVACRVAAGRGWAP